MATACKPCKASFPPAYSNTAAHAPSAVAQNTRCHTGGSGCPPEVTQLFIGGRNDNLFNFEGKIDEVAVYKRPLTAQEAAEHFVAAQGE